MASAILKMTPDGWVEKIPTGKFVNEDTQMDNKILDMYNKVATGGVDEAPAALDEADEEFKAI